MAMCSKNCCATLFFFLLYLFVANFLKMSHFWGWANDWEMECKYPPLPVNRSGVKVLIGGFAKTGTWSMTSTLFELGLKKSFHNQEFMLHVFSKIADRYWMQPENGGRQSRNWHHLNMIDQGKKLTGGQVGTVAADKAGMLPDSSQVLEHTSTETLAEYTSKCQIDSIAFDGIEHLYWPMYKASPDAKVILLDWRSYDSWQHSMARFGPKWLLTVVLTGQLYGSIFGLPWGLALKAVDSVTGRQIENMLTTAGPAFLQECPVPVALWQTFINQRRIVSHWIMGLHWVHTREEYEQFYADVRKATPPERLLRWNFKKNTYEDLCNFLDIKPCPKSGKLRHVPNMYAWEPGLICDEPIWLAPVYLLLHWINWKVYCALFLGLWRILRRLAGKSKQQ